MKTLSVNNILTILRIFRTLLAEERVQKPAHAIPGKNPKINWTEKNVTKITYEF